MKVLNKFLKNGTGNYVECVVKGRTGRGPVRSTSCETPHNTFKIASWNIGTMRGRSSEIVETITRRNVDLCCVQEVRWRGASAIHITGKDSRYKFFWVGNNQGTSGVGVLLAEKWVDKVYDIKRVSARIDQITSRGGCPHGIVCLCPSNRIRGVHKGSILRQPANCHLRTTRSFKDSSP